MTNISISLIDGALQVRVDQGIMLMKEYSTLPKPSGLESHHQMQFSVICRTLVRG